MAAALIEGLFVVWLLLSLLVHIPALRSMRRHLKLGGLIPNWYLFTSEILMYDLCLRFRNVTDQQAPWHDLPMVSKPRPWRFIWNPQRRISKALLDSADAIIQARLSGARERALKSVPFKILLEWARRHAQPPAQTLQFCIALRADLRPESGPSILFLSPIMGKNVPVD
jgi:hypothetical protein